MSKYAANAYQYFKSCLCTQIILMHTFEGLISSSSKVSVLAPEY